MWGVEGEKILQFSPDESKNTTLYVFVFIKHDERFCYINMIEADSREKPEKQALGQGDRQKEEQDRSLHLMKHLLRAAGTT